MALPIDGPDQRFGAAILMCARPADAFLVQESVHLLVQNMLIAFVAPLLLGEILHGSKTFDAVLETAEILEGIDALLADNISLELEGVQLRVYVLLFVIHGNDLLAVSYVIAQWTAAGLLQLLFSRLAAHFPHIVIRVNTARIGNLPLALLRHLRLSRRVHLRTDYRIITQPHNGVLHFERPHAARASGFY